MATPFDVIELLTLDHVLLNELLDRLDLEDRPAEMRALFLRIADELAAHEAAEHDVVFPAVWATIGADDDELFRLLAEHDEINSLLDEMFVFNPAGFGFAKGPAP